MIDFDTEDMKADVVRRVTKALSPRAKKLKKSSSQVVHWTCGCSPQSKYCRVRMVKCKENQTTQCERFRQSTEENLEELSVTVSHFVPTQLFVQCVTQNSEYCKRIFRWWERNRTARAIGVRRSEVRGNRPFRDSLGELRGLFSTVTEIMRTLSWNA